MKIMCKGVGIDPEKALIREAFAEPHGTRITPRILKTARFKY